MSSHNTSVNAKPYSIYNRDLIPIIVIVVVIVVIIVVVIVTVKVIVIPTTLRPFFQVPPAWGRLFLTVAALDKEGLSDFGESLSAPLSAASRRRTWWCFRWLVITPWGF